MPNLITSISAYIRSLQITNHILGIYLNDGIFPFVTKLFNFCLISYDILQLGWNEKPVA